MPTGRAGVFVCPDTITEVAGYAFRGCTKITGIQIPNAVTRIGNGAFVGCTSLKSMVLPENLTNLNSYVFQNCTSLTDLVIHKNVKKIYGHVFDGSTNIKNVYVLGRTTEFSSVSGLGNSKPTIYGYKGSTAQTYAGTYLTFIDLNSQLVMIPTVDNADYTSGSNGVCTVYCSGALADLQSVKVDGNIVPASNYTLEEGSTIVKFNAAYMETLSQGDHTVTLVYNSGSVDSTIHVKESCKHSYDNACDPSCNLCGETRDASHNWGNIQSNDSQHWYTCSKCGSEKDRADHAGDGTYCSACGKQYGNFTHTCSYTAEVASQQYLKTAATCCTKATYYKSCPSCGSKGTETFVSGGFNSTNHSGETEIRDAVAADCTNAGYTGDTYCVGCGSKLSSGTTIESSGEHGGGTATCQEKAICSGCNQPYGELGQCSYTDYKANDDATCEKDGTKTAKCDYCDSTNTVTDEGSRTDHSYGEDGICDVCGYVSSTPETEPATGETTTNNETAANNSSSGNIVPIIIVIVVVLLAAGAAVVVIMKKKK